MNPADVPPAATATLEGTVAFAFPLDSVTVSPPLGAALLSVTVHADVPGPVTLDGLQVSLGLGATTTTRLSVAEITGVSTVAAAFLPLAARTLAVDVDWLSSVAVTSAVMLLRPLALLFVDLDDFKVVNDTLGHPVGDELVIRVGERFLGAIRVSDTVARFGGDEFAVLVEGDSDAVDVGTRLVDCLRPAFSLAGEQLSIGASIGIAEVAAGQPTPSLDELYSRADIAMYAAKRSGKGQVAMYEPAMVLPEAADLHFRPLLIEAIRARDIECHFQPIVDLANAKIYSMEALARWRVGGEMVDQEYFIKLTGRLGLMPELTDLMLDLACGQLADWTARLGCEDLQVGVNVPAELMNDRDFPRRVAGSLHRHGLGPDRLLLEITEDALLGETAVAEGVAERLRKLGVHLWLDDFGTGYSSLLSLRQIPLQAVKIDIAFVANIHTDPSAERFLRALLTLGRDLDLLVTAEGVECAAQADILRSLGCQFVQGYLYARAAPAAELEHLLHSSQAISSTPSGTYLRSALL